jgi:hypothetical protein
MGSQSHVAKVTQSINLLFLLGCLSGVATSVLAQNESPTAITKLTTVDLQPIGHPPSGPYRVVVEHARCAIPTVKPCV